MVDSLQKEIKHVCKIDLNCIYMINFETILNDKDFFVLLHIFWQNS